MSAPGTARTVVDLLDERLGEIALEEAYVDGHRRITFGEWDRAARGVATLLVSRGVRRSDVVCLLMGSSIDYAVCYLAALRVGAITSGINPRLGDAEIASILDRTCPALTVVGEGLTVPAGASRVVPVEEVRASYREEPLEWSPPRATNDAVAIVWTSGTTGSPKGALYDHSNLAAVAEAMGDLSAPGDRRLSPLPFAHVGYMTRLWDEISRGITTVIVPAPWKAGVAIALMETERVTVAQGVPTQWRLMLDHPRFGTADLSHVRIAGTGAAAASPELIGEIRSRLGCPVVVGYASTETAVIAKSSTGDRDDDVARTVGKPASGVDVALLGDDGVPVAQGEVGTVAVRSAATMRGYYRDPALTEKARTPDGWILTGDLGRFDPRGYLTLAGRRTEMYVRGGYNVYPVEVEFVLGAHPGVLQVAVVGAPDPVLGEVGVAFVATQHHDVPPTTEELRAWCVAHLADYKAPDVVEHVGDLPLTAMGKIDKGLLAPRAAELARARGTRASGIPS